MLTNDFVDFDERRGGPKASGVISQESTKFVLTFTNILLYSIYLIPEEAKGQAIRVSSSKYPLWNFQKIYDEYKNYISTLSYIYYFVQANLVRI